MAYSPFNLEMTAGKRGGKRRIWTYASTDAVNTVRAANYISDALIKGMKVGDVVIVQVLNGSGVPTASNICTVMAVTTSGADLSDGTALTLTNT